MSATAVPVACRAADGVIVLADCMGGGGQKYQAQCQDAERTNDLFFIMVPPSVFRGGGESAPPSWEWIPMTERVMTLS